MNTLFFGMGAAAVYALISAGIIFKIGGSDEVQNSAEIYNYNFDYTRLG